MTVKTYLMKILAALLLSLALPVAAATLEGRVVGVSDGDTITVLDRQNVQHRIRLSAIDAPEKAQPFGNRSKQNMERMAKGKEALADCPKTDRYGRKVCKVWVQPGDCPTCGMTLDVGYAQVSAGLAWWYRAYAKEQSAEDRGLYESEENEARLRRHGLWIESSAVPPWDWRRNKKVDK